MAISYPRALPSTRILGVEFELDLQESFSPEHGGRFVSTQLGPALWGAKYSTTPPNEVEFSKWRAWLDSLDGAALQFYGYDARRPLPWNYRSGLPEGFDGTSSTWEANEARDEITVDDLPVAFALIEGDYIGLQWETHKRSVHRVLAPSNAGGDGVGVWTVRPHIHPEIPADAVVNLVKPAALMRITNRDRNAEHKDRRVAFEAKQDLEL